MSTEYRKDETKNRENTIFQYDQPVMDQQSSIKRIVAQGNVRIKADRDRSGTCGKATYEAKSDLLTLEGDPVLREGPNTIQGEVIKLYIEENRSEVIGGKKRVEAIFITPDNIEDRRASCRERV